MDSGVWGVGFAGFVPGLCWGGEGKEGGRWLVLVEKVEES